MQVSTMKPEAWLLSWLPHIAQLTFPGARIFFGIRTHTPYLANIIRHLRIDELRGQAAVVDSDLATIYGVTAKALNQATKRNVLRFPSDFLFRLTAEEWDALRSLGHRSIESLTRTGFQIGKGDGASAVCNHH